LLNWITPHQKWGIHSTYSDNLIMQTLSRGGPIVWLSEDDARSAGIVDNDWIELFNVNGAIAARAVVSQRVMPGMAMMYHAQERIINVPGSQITGTRGGIHNSVTRIVLKPTHMIGGYAQLAYGFNYYGTCGTNRDEFVIVRKMDKIDWLDDEQGSSSAARRWPLADAGQDLRQPGPAADRRLLRAVRLRLPEPAHRQGQPAPADRAAAFADQRRAHAEDRVGPELGGDPRFGVQQALARLQLQ